MNSEERFLQEIVERLGLVPHPEGGYYREFYRSTLDVNHPAVPPGEHNVRSGITSIYWLISAGDFSAFHRVKWTDEIWHLYAGDPLEIHVITSAGVYEKRMLSTQLTAGVPVTVVEAGFWQAARTVPGGRWSFCGCTVAPGFDFADWEMPEADRLIARFPEHAAIIKTLTRS